MHRCILGAFLIFFSSLGIAQEDFFSDINIEAKVVEPSSTSVKGFIQQKIKVGVQQPDQNFAFQRDSSGLSQVQMDAFGEIKSALAKNVSLKVSAKAEIDWVEWESGELEYRSNHERLFLRDAFFDITFDNGVWIRAGHQLFAWGESEGLTITDILSPQDLREFGQAELQDIREQVPAVMTLFPVLGGTMSVVLTYDAGHNRFADRTEEFFPYLVLAEQGVRVSTQSPSNQSEIALRYEKQFNGGDISIVAANINDNDFVVNQIVNGVAQLTQERVSTLGMAANRVRDSWLFKLESGVFWNQPVNSEDGFIEQDQLRGMLGFEYSGWDEWLVTYEINAINVIAGPDIDNADQPGQTLRFQYTTNNEKLVQTLWWLDIVGDNGSVIRYDITYDLNDMWELGGALVAYENSQSSSTLFPYRNNDTVNVSVKYNF